MEILSSCMDCDEIQFKEDGSWAPMRSKKEVQEVSASYNNGLDGKIHVSCLPRQQVSMVTAVPLASCRPSDQRSSSSSLGGSDGGIGRKVEVIDLTLDSSSDDEGQDSPPPPLPPPPKRSCPSMSPTSPLVINKGLDVCRGSWEGGCVFCPASHVCVFAPAEC